MEVGKSKSEPSTERGAGPGPLGQKPAAGEAGASEEAKGGSA